MIRYLLPIFTFLLPFENLFTVLFSRDTPFAPFRVLGVVLLGVTMIRFLLVRVRYRWDLFDWGFLFILLVGVLMAILWHLILHSGNMGWMAAEAVLMVFGFAIYLVFRRAAPDETQIRMALTAFVIGTVMSIVLGAIVSEGFAGGRFSAFYGNPNRLGVAAGASLVLVLAQVMISGRRSGWTSRGWAALCVLILVVGLAFTGSFSAILATGISLMSLLATLRWRVTHAGRRSSMALVLVLPLVLVSGLLLNSAFSQYQSNSEALNRYQVTLGLSGSEVQQKHGFIGAFRDRLRIWEAAWNFGEDRFFTGAGTAQYRSHHQEYVLALGKSVDIEIREHQLGVHSDFINILVSNGAIALLVFLTILIQMIRGLRRRLRGSSRALSMVYAYPAVLALLMTWGSTHVMWSSPEYWLFMALIAHESALGLRVKRVSPAITARFVDSGARPPLIR